VVSGDKRSRTAQAVAAERALLTDMSVVNDPFARKMLGPSMAALYSLVRRWPNRVPTLPVTLAGLAARVLWHDAQVIGAIEDGVQQIVVVGAGYDSRAWRLCGEGVQFFELDHPATQLHKARLAPQPGPTYVQADLNVESAMDALRLGGLDRERPALFVLEGVTMYLDEQTVRDQLTELSNASAPGSRLTTDFYPPEGIGTAHDQRQRRVQHLARSGSGESLRLLVSRTDAVALVDACGWKVVDAISLRAAAQALVPDGRGLPLNAVSEDKALVSAVTRTSPATSRPQRGTVVEPGGRLADQTSGCSWSASLRGTPRGIDQFGQERLDPAVDLLDDGPHLLDRLAGRVGEVPVEVALAGMDRARVPAAHGDDHVGGAGDLVADGFGELLGGIESAFGEDRGDRRVDLVARLGPGRPDLDAAVGVVIQQDPSSSAASGVVGAQEQDGGDVFHDHSLGLAEKQSPVAVAVGGTTTWAADWAMSG
jgi:methyltransferase (TIGR00027 family)